MNTIKNKSRGTDVKILQVFLGVSADGICGKKTIAAINNWKTKQKLTVNSEIGAKDWEIIANSLPTIKINSKGKEVKMWQLLLGITADGIFGSKTKASTRAYQSTNGLTVDGIVNKTVWVKALTAAVTITVPVQTTTNKQPVNYKQYDKRWGSVVYTKNNTYNKKQTIKNSGCGPTSMADIVATWWDSKVTPVEMCALSVKNGFRTNNSGTAWGFFKFVADKYGASKFIKTSSYATAETAVKNGAYVVCSMKPGLFTKGGHYICWWKCDGTYNYTNDPASSAAKRAKQEIKYIKNECKQFFIFYRK